MLVRQEENTPLHFPRGFVKKLDISLNPLVLNLIFPLAKWE
jgi:hypothetical protein